MFLIDPWHQLSCFVCHRNGDSWCAGASPAGKAAAAALDGLAAKNVSPGESALLETGFEEADMHRPLSFSSASWAVDLDPRTGAMQSLRYIANDTEVGRDVRKVLTLLGFT